MLWANLNCFYGILLFIAAIIVCSMYAYYVDAKRLDDDPQKKNYRPLALLLAPITLPLFVILYVSLLFLRVVGYGVFIALFPFALIFIRKPFILEWLKKIALKIGNLLLEANTSLIRIFLRPLTGSSGSA